MNKYNSFFLVSILSLGLSLSACSKPEEDLNSSIPAEMLAHPSSLKGSLIESTNANTPTSFAKEVINERTYFKSEIKSEGNEVDQYIFNDDGGFTLVAFWEKTSNGFDCKGLAINIAQPITPDNLQVLKRLIYRLHESNDIEQAVLKNTNFTALSNGSGLTIKNTEDSIQYEIY
ncbi:MAG: hypothetical protein RSC68_01040 [Acinetobacter sp.]